MILFLYGADTYRSRQHLHKIIEKFKTDRDPQGYNVSHLDCLVAEQSEILEQILSVPFLSEKRLVVLENLFLSKKESVTKELQDRIAQNRIPESNIVVFWEGVEEKKIKGKELKEFFAELKKEKFAQEFAPLTGSALTKWIDQEVISRGGTIERQANQYLANQLKENSWLLHHIVNQLIAYADGKPITFADTQLFLHEKADDSIFTLVDSIVHKQPKQVFNMMAEQYAKGEDAAFIFAMLVRQFRILLQLRDLYDRDETLHSDILAKKLNLHPFVVKKSLPLVKRYSLEKLKHIYTELLQLDIQTKTGLADQSLLLDVFVGKVTLQSN